MIRALKSYPLLYALVLPGILYFLIFYYVPMFGIVIAFQDYSPFQGVRGIFTSEWVGFQHFQNFFTSFSFTQVMTNTLLLGMYTIIFGFPAPILLALLLNEVVHGKFKKWVQTISYLPHFLSMVVVVGILNLLLSSDGGIINEVVKLFGNEPITFMGEEKYYRSIIILTQIWQQIGWESIIFLAAIVSINTDQYEAAIIDGASKFRQIWHITLPGILPVIMIMFILRMGTILNGNYELILLTYSPSTIDVADIIDTFVYREGLVQMNFSYSTAVGFFKSVFSAALLLGTNYMAKRAGQNGIW
ncbi:ABC transporter permease [Paenibacillus eucommiae]|uniref:Aldouronate transport system permease protein n=1 Tax=Paenibacillus eucommiae TaxID=1355755 RepID=A0ABS4J4K3_9BACL|nr:ABC transporter permease subunit [Paenibacillus eucommiae]MBP1994738.1 putative aldouronate transport system permease protein [Paenibacillus eucommiae]